MREQWQCETETGSGFLTCAEEVIENRKWRSFFFFLNINEVKIKI